jgi:flagella basal body P-ring formation protein FlgA
MKLLISATVAIFLIGTWVGAGNAATLRPDVVVDANVIRLGDLFIDIGEKSNLIVAPAPAPGKRNTLSARRLQKIARRAGIDWNPESRYARAVVKRAGRVINSGEIESIIDDALRNSGLPREYKVELSKGDLSVHISAAETRQLKVINPRYNLTGRRFSVIVEVPRDGSTIERMQVTGKLYENVEVPVLSRVIRRGDVIREGDIEFVNMSRDRVGRNVILDVARIIGKSPRRFVRTGKPIRMGDVRSPIIVSKGDLVTLLVQTDQLLITSKGVALQDGARGEVVRIRNTRSRTTIEGVVTGPNRVNILIAGAIQ